MTIFHVNIVNQNHTALNTKLARQPTDEEEKILVVSQITVRTISYLWTKFKLGWILFITFYVHSYCRTTWSCAAESKDDARIITKYDTNALNKKQFYINIVQFKYFIKM